LSETDDHEDGGREEVRFDDFNVVVNHSEVKEFIHILVNVPLADGAMAKAKVTLRAPVRFVDAEGKYQYKMNFDTKLSVTQAEKTPTGDIKVAEQDGLSWEIPAGYPGARTALLEHEPSVKEFLTSRFRPGEVFVDVGANIGAYSLRAASSGMKVHSFEPNPENIKVLKRNVEINHLSIELVECGLGSVEGQAKMSPNGALSRLSAEGAVVVPIHTLDGFDLTRVDLLKIDVEGHELEVIKGARKTIGRWHPTVVIEMHDWLGAEDQAALLNVLLENGYRFKYVDKHTYGRHLVALHGRERSTSSPSPTHRTRRSR
jgi:FkbM family methyltransferase